MLFCLIVLAVDWQAQAETEVASLRTEMADMLTTQQLLGLTHFKTLFCLPCHGRQRRPQTILCVHILCGEHIRHLCSE
jgi:hypothetical protein